MGISGWWRLSVHHDQGRLVRRSNARAAVRPRKIGYSPTCLEGVFSGVHIQLTLVSVRGMASIQSGW